MSETVSVVHWGYSPEAIRAKKAWLQQDRKRRLIVVAPRLEFAPEPHSQLVYHWYDSPLAFEPIAQAVAETTVLQPTELIDVTQEPGFDLFSKALGQLARQAVLSLSDGADWGVQALRNAKHNLSVPFRRALDLAGAFDNMPALIVGAGPSLAHRLTSIEARQDQCLIFASGSALPLLKDTYHVSGWVDPQAVGKPAASSIATIAPRAKLARQKGDALPYLVAPDAHFQYFEPLLGVLDTGWTVGTFLMALAVHWGCNPIVFVGFDGCYEEGRKYAGSGGAMPAALVPTVDRFGKTVMTQSDWLMARDWIEALAKKHPDRMFIDVSGRGLRYEPLILDRSLTDLAWPGQDIRGALQRAVSRLPQQSAHDFWAHLRRSLQTTQQQLLPALQGELLDLDGDAGYEVVLKPLWQLWKGVFAREEGDLKIHELVFYDAVLREYLSALT
ncbi:MAG: hypothetical protein RL235_968 [Chlamydiota bacterium]|jgi:hypothetical protein